MSARPWGCLVSGAVGVPGVAAAVDGGAVGLAPDGVGDPGRADGDAEVVAVRESVPGRALVGRAGSAVGELHLAGPAAPPLADAVYQVLNAPVRLSCQASRKSPAAGPAASCGKLLSPRGLTSTGVVQVAPVLEVAT